MKLINGAAKITVATQNVAHKTAEAAKKVPGKTSDAKVGFGRKLLAMKAEYVSAVQDLKTTDAEVIDTEVIINSHGDASAQQNAFRMLEITEGK